MSNNRIYRSQHDRYVGGVAAGIAHYFDVQPIFIRICFVVLGLFHGIGVVLYVILVLTLPDGTSRSKHEEFAQASEIFEDVKENFKQKVNMETQNKSNGNVIGGVILIAIGALFLLEKFIPEIRFGDVWPILLIVIGIMLIIKNPMKKKKSED